MKLDDSLSLEEKERMLLELQAELAELKQKKLELLKKDKLGTQPLNRKQIEFIEADATEVMLSGPNGQGKSTALRADASIDTTGLYPDWYQGPKIREPFNGMVAGATAEKTRDLIVNYLLGPPGERGTGYIPAHCIDEKRIKYVRRGLPDQVDTFQVLHHNPDTGKPNGWTTIHCEAYAKGATRQQGARYKRIWIDEEPDDDRVYDEYAARLVGVKDSQLKMVLSPTLGATPLFLKFYNSDDPKMWLFIRYSIDDADHLTEEEKQYERRRFQHSPLRSARLEGLPVLGEGMLIPFTDEQIRIRPFHVPFDFYQIIGLDFPHTSGRFAAVKWAKDPNTQVRYLVEVYRAEGLQSPTYAERVKAMGGRRIPCAWPHDGGRRVHYDSQEKIRERYEALGLRMTHNSARYDDGNNSKIIAIEELNDAFAMGTAKVFDTCAEFFEEKNQYRQVDGKIIKGNDDVIDAALKGWMMEREMVQLGDDPDPFMSSRRPRKGAGSAMKRNFYRTRRRR